MAEMSNGLPKSNEPELQELLDYVAKMDPDTRAELAEQVRALRRPNMTRFAELMLKYCEIVDARRRRQYVWEADGVDNEDLFTLLDEMLWQAVETLALEPYRIPKDDTDAPVGRARSATSRIALVVVPFLMDRAAEIDRLRPSYITEIYEQAIEYARTQSEDWMPSDTEAEHYARAYAREQGEPLPAA